MKTYFDYIENINFKDTWIPKSLDNPYYQCFLKELENGEAELIPYASPIPTWEEIRNKRDNLLKDSDWAIMTDANPKPSKQAWLDYRQALRDIPQNFTIPQDVIWPTKP